MYPQALSLFLGLIITLAPATHAAQAAHDTISVDGPTILAFILIVPGEIDADPSGDMAVIADDFSYFLGSAMPALDSLGIRVFQTVDPAIVLRLPGERPFRFSVLGPDSLRAGYWFLGGGKKAEYLGGGVNPELIRRACTHFEIPLPDESR